MTISADHTAHRTRTAGSRTGHCTEDAVSRGGAQVRHHGRGLHAARPAPDPDGGPGRHGSNPHTEQGTEPGHEYPLPGDEELLAAYEQLVVGRRVNDQASALVRQGRLAVYPSSHGQEACQVAAALCLVRRRLAVPHLPRHRRRDGPRRRPRRGADAPPRRLALRLRPRQAQGRHPVHPAGHPAAARRRRRPRRQAARRGHRGPGHVRRRRHQRGRLPRGAELRRRLPPARWSSSCRTTSTPSPSRWPSRPSRRRSRTRASATACPASASTATTSSRCSPCSAAPSSCAREGAGPLLVEAHTYRMQAHTNADDATRYRQDGEVAEWVAKDPMTRLETYLTDRGLLDDDGAAADRRARPKQSPPSCATASARTSRWTRRTCSPTSSPSPPRS